MIPTRTVYQHVNERLELRTGTCISRPEMLPNVDAGGWEWLDGQHRLFWEEYDELMEYAQKVAGEFSRP
ncbi:MAG: hypothetical protein A9Z00_02350 [Thermobacillus sp. ZCTH02-B1]|uniref:hypothetical protein n=1 Tax=Thermobacillus sp. ZCTH02-B1 TaxID=1858795 RepID=UPI000B55A9CA|nr:hypothetical protein [Thermobacillus sp. ZCTH02-B1]OUM93785.1 MAG: hypothetical protein A9Z00_02350 [Thermobacillus sp. ZCTH02-B1]